MLINFMQQVVVNSVRLEKDIGLSETRNVDIKNNFSPTPRRVVATFNKIRD